MPIKNALKVYVDHGFYHVYNRGVENRNIFLDEQDYQVFLFYLKTYLLPKKLILEEIEKSRYFSSEEKIEKIAILQRLKNFYHKIELNCFVLMPNHYHLLLRQIGKRDMEDFMRSINTRYGKYFNRKYQRIGHLFQSRYKAVLIEKEEYFLHLSRYIHLNPKKIISPGKKLSDYPWSSYPFFLSKKKSLWLNKEQILSYFKKTKGYGFSSYQGFVEGHKESFSDEVEIYKKLLLD